MPHPSLSYCLRGGITFHQPSFSRFRNHCVSGTFPLPLLPFVCSITVYFLTWTQSYFTLSLPRKYSFGTSFSYSGILFSLFFSDSTLSSCILMLAFYLMEFVHQNKLINLTVLLQEIVNYFVRRERK